MKKIKGILSIFALLLALLLIPQSVHASSNIDIKNMNVAIKVREDGVYEIHETVDVYFNGRNQGIFVNIPQKYEDFTFNGVTRDYFFPVSNFKMISDDEVSIKSDFEGIGAKIGTEGVYYTGDKRYEYSYEIQTNRLSGIENMDLFYLNIVGQNWEMKIENIEFSVEFPKAFSQEPKLMVPGAEEYLTYSVDGNTVSGTYSGTLYKQALTMSLELPEGYFTYPKTNVMPIAIVLLVVLGGLMVFLYFKFGKDEKPIEVVTFTAPKGLSSAEIGYIYRGHSTTKDIVSLIVYWASRGFLSLEELDEKGKDIRITKLKELEDYTNPEEKRVFNALFKKGEVITTGELNETFGETVMHASSNIRRRFTAHKEMNIYDKSSSVIKVFGYLFTVIIAGLFFGFAYYTKTIYIGYFFIGLAVGAPLTIVYLLVSTFAFNRDGINSPIRSKGVRFLMAILALLILFGLCALGYYVFEAQLWHVIVFAITMIVVSASLSNMGRRTELGNKWFGEILGLQTFIEVAEESRIRALVEETPYLFYDVLPYAYVLGISDVWIKQFEKLTLVQPDWYVSSSPNFTTFYMLNSLNRSMRTINSSMVSVPAPKASSGGGGSFGGGGGGGFSGGGFGGSGGGGW